MTVFPKEERGWLCVVAMLLVAALLSRCGDAQAHVDCDSPDVICLDSALVAPITDTGTTYHDLVIEDGRDLCIPPGEYRTWKDAVLAGIVQTKAAERVPVPETLLYSEGCWIEPAWENDVVYCKGHELQKHCFDVNCVPDTECIIHLGTDCVTTCDQFCVQGQLKEVK